MHPTSTHAATNNSQYSSFFLQSAPVDLQNINKLPPALMRRYDVYIHTEKRIPNPDKDVDMDAPAMPAAAAGAKSQTHEQPVTPLRRVAAQHIGKLVRVRVRRLSMTKQHLGLHNLPPFPSSHWALPCGSRLLPASFECLLLALESFKGSGLQSHSAGRR